MFNVINIEPIYQSTFLNPYWLIGEWFLWQTGYNIFDSAYLKDIKKSLKNFMQEFHQNSKQHIVLFFVLE